MMEFPGEVERVGIIVRGDGVCALVGEAVEGVVPRATGFDGGGGRGEESVEGGGMRGCDGGKGGRGGRPR